MPRVFRQDSLTVAALIRVVTDTLLCRTPIGGAVRLCSCWGCGRGRESPADAPGSVWWCGFLGLGSFWLSYHRQPRGTAPLFRVYRIAAKLGPRLSEREDATFIQLDNGLVSPEYSKSTATFQDI